MILIKRAHHLFSIFFTRVSSILLLIDFFKVFLRSFGVWLDRRRIFIPIGRADFTMFLHKLEGFDKSQSFLNRSANWQVIYGHLPQNTLKKKVLKVEKSC